MTRPFIRGRVAIDSMRDNGFLSAAHALAELIDNSIQSKADRIELITFETKCPPKKEGGRAAKRVEKIAVLDNGSGMSKDTLHLALEFGASENRKDNKGIGKFGMGLPNSSISQCKHVDVWSWQSKDDYYYTYLDIDEIKNGDLETIPEPVARGIPDEVKSVCGETLPSSGTLVLWSNIDRCQWKTGKSIFKHTQDIVGRMYRNFLHNDEVSIVFKSTEKIGRLFSISEEHRFKANDPLYLMKQTSLPDLPGEFAGESMFELVNDCNYEFQIPDENGKKQTVKIVGSVLKKSVLDVIKPTTSNKIGATEWGKHALKNIGLSIVRSRREIALDDSFILPELKARGIARFMGIEISFDPSLDIIFGVTNNKQHAVNLKMIKAADDFEKEGFESEQDYRSDLYANNDPKLRIYQVVNHIKEVEKILRVRLEGYSYDGTASTVGLNTEDSKSAGGTIGKVNQAEERREELYSTEPPTYTKAEVVEFLKNKGAENPAEKATLIAENELKVWVEAMPISTTAFFDVSVRKGLTLLQINSNHVFSKRILESVEPGQREILELCLAGWARMERECSSDKRRAQLEMARKDWGQLLEDYLEDSD